MVYRGRSDFDVEVLFLVGELEYERPRELIDTNVVTIDKDTTAADANTDVYQLCVLPYNTTTSHHIIQA